MVIHIIDAQIPDSLSAGMFPVKVETQVKGMAGRKPVIVAGRDKVCIA